MIPQYPQQFPTPRDPLSDKAGQVSQVWYYLLNAIWNRSGGGSGIPNQVQNGIAAAGATQSTATQLNLDYNEVTSGANLGVSLNADLQKGQSQIVFNGTGSSINVYPAPVANALLPQKGIDAIAVNQPYVLASGKTQIFTMYSATLARTLQLG